MTRAAIAMIIGTIACRARDPGPIAPDPAQPGCTEPRYAIAVYVERRGFGGGVAAGIAADVTRLIATHP